MAEFLQPIEVGTQIGPVPVIDGEDGFSAMGKPVSLKRRQAGCEHCAAMGLSGADSWSLVGEMSEALERDKPYDAMAVGMKHLDLTGTYRLMAVLLTA